MTIMEKTTRMIVKNQMRWPNHSLDCFLGFFFAEQWLTIGNILTMTVHIKEKNEEKMPILHSCFIGINLIDKKTVGTNK